MPTILTKRSNTPGAIPATANLTNAAGGAELAVNTADKRIFTINSSSAVVELGTNPASLTCADVSATVLRAGSATITNLIATTATVSDLSATVARISSLTISSLSLSNATFGSATITNLTSTSATITNLLATSLTVSSGSTLNGGVVINEPGADVDFRVEGDTDANLFFVDASADRIGIGTNAPGAKVNLEAADNVSEVRLSRASTNIWGSIQQRSTSGALGLAFNANDGNASTPGFVWRTATDGSTFTEQMVLNTTGLGIGTTSPGQKLVVAGNIQGDSWIGRSNISAPSADAAIYRAADNTLAFSTASTERARITSGGSLLVGTTSGTATITANASGGATIRALRESVSATNHIQMEHDGTNGKIAVSGANALLFDTNSTERARITTSGILGVGVTNPTGSSADAVGAQVGPGYVVINRSSAGLIFANRRTTDGELVRFLQDDVAEGDISVSGTTVSYNGGHLSRWSQTADNTRIPLLKGTIMSNLDQMAVWEKDDQPLPNEQLNCMKVSDVEGDVNVAGVFVNWDNDDDEYTNDMNVAMTGDMIIRIAQGVVVQRGDLLMSAGDGTAKPQGDDIIRSKTVAKVTSNHVTCTYEDGSYCVPCVLMAC